MASRPPRDKANSQQDMTFYILCLIKRLIKMSKFAKFTLVNAMEFSLFRFYRRNFWNQSLNLLRRVTFWQRKKKLSDIAAVCTINKACVRENTPRDTSEETRASKICR